MSQSPMCPGNFPIQKSLHFPRFLKDFPIFSSLWDASRFSINFRTRCTYFQFLRESKASVNPSMVEKQGSPPGGGKEEKRVDSCWKTFFDGFRDALGAVQISYWFISAFFAVVMRETPVGVGEGISEGGGRGTPTHPLRKNLCCETLLYPFELICPKIYTLGI